MKKLLLIFLIGMTSCVDGTERDIPYRIHVIGGDEVKVIKLDSAYKVGDVITLPGDSLDRKFTIEERVK